MNETTRRFLRTLLQLVAGGGLTALFEQLAHDVPAAYTPYILIAATLIVTLAQNYLESIGAIPPVLKPPTVPVAEANARIEEAFDSTPGIGKPPLIK